MTMGFEARGMDSGGSCGASLMTEGRTRAGCQTRMPFGAQQRSGLLPNDRFASGDLLAALLEGVVGDGLEVVDVVEVNVLQKVHLGFDVPRHRDVDQQQGPVFAELHDRLQFGAVENVMRRGGAADDDVDSFKFHCPLPEMNGASAEFPAQASPPVMGSVRNKEPSRPATEEPAAGFLAVLARPEDH